MADKKITARYGSLKKAPDQGIFCGHIKINHNIPAKDNIKRPLELNRIHQIKRPENNILTDNRRNGIGASAILYKIFVLP